MIVTERRGLEDALYSEVQGWILAWIGSFCESRPSSLSSSKPSHSLTSVSKTPDLGTADLRKDRPFLLLAYRFETLAFLVLALIRRLAF